MINLLGPEDKKQLRAARSNVVLLRYYFLAFLLIAGSGAILGFGFYIAEMQKNSAQASLVQAEDDTQDYEKVKRQSEEFSKNLSVAKQILAAEVVYSKMITDIASTIPPGTILTSLSLTPETINKKMELSFKTKNYNEGIQLKTTLENSDLFSDVSITSITSKDESTGDSTYPTNVNISAMLHPRNLLPNSLTTGTAQ